MLLSAIELGVINIALTSLPPDEQDKSVAKEVLLLIRTCVDEEKVKFVESEVDLKVTHRSFLVQFIPKVKWTTPQLVEMIDPLIEKLNT